MISSTASIVVILGAVSVLLAFYVLAHRVWMEQRRASALAVHAHLAECACAFRDGRAELAAALSEFKPYRYAIGVEALLKPAAQASSEQLIRLRRLFAATGYEARAIAALQHRAATRRTDAATHLSYLGDTASLPALRARLRDPDAIVRLSAANAMARIGGADSVQTVLHTLADLRDVPLQRAAEILQGLGAPAIAPLTGVLRDETDKQELVIATTTLGLLGAEQALPELLPLLRHKEETVRIACAKALGQIGDARAADGLMAALEDPVWEVRGVAAKSLGMLHQERAVEPLRKHLADRAWWVRYNAALALEQIGSRGIRALIETAAHDADRFARDISHQILGRYAGQLAQARI